MQRLRTSMLESAASRLCDLGLNSSVTQFPSSVKRQTCFNGYGDVGRGEAWRLQCIDPEDELRSGSSPRGWGLCATNSPSCQLPGCEGWLLSPSGLSPSPMGAPLVVNMAPEPSCCPACPSGLLVGRGLSPASSSCHLPCLLSASFRGQKLWASRGFWRWPEALEDLARVLDSGEGLRPVDGSADGSDRALRQIWKSWLQG